MKRKQIDNSDKICIYCGVNHSTRFGDHVPPKSWIPSSIRQRHPCRLVASCEECNQGFILDDEKFRLHMVSTQDVENSEAASEIRDIAIRGLSKPKQTGLRKRFLQGAKLINTYSYGGIYLGKRYGFDVDFELIDRVFNRITRAFYHLHFDRTIPDSHNLRTLCWNLMHKEQQNAYNSQLAPAIAKRKLHEVCPGAFVYKYVSIKEFDGSLMWLYALYDNQFFFTFVDSPELAKELEAHENRSM